MLLLGILLFLGAHTVPTLPGLKRGLVATLGEGPYKGLLSLMILTGLGLIAWGFSQYRVDGWIQVWTPPAGMRHLTILLMWFAFVALASMGKRPGRIKGWLKHPMLVAIKIWALAHLLANGDLGGMVLFGSFLAWAVYDRISVRRRGEPTAPASDSFTGADMVAIGAGTIAFVAMILAHPYLIGVAVIGG